MSAREGQRSACSLSCLLTIGMQTWRLVGAERRVQALELAPQKQATVVAAAKVETVTVRLAAAERVVCAS
jgi:hypothetical protein